MRVLPSSTVTTGSLTASEDATEGVSEFESQLERVPARTRDARTISSNMVFDFLMMWYYIVSKKTEYPGNHQG